MFDSSTWGPNHLQGARGNMWGETSPHVLLHHNKGQWDVRGKISMADTEHWQLQGHSTALAFMLDPDTCVHQLNMLRRCSCTWQVSYTVVMPPPGPPTQLQLSKMRRSNLHPSLEGRGQMVAAGNKHKCERAKM